MHSSPQWAAVALSGGSRTRDQREAFDTFHPAHLYVHYQFYCTRSVVQYMQLHVLKKILKIRKIFCIFDFKRHVISTF